MMTIEDASVPAARATYRRDREYATQNSIAARVREKVRRRKELTIELAVIDSELNELRRALGIPVTADAVDLSLQPHTVAQSSSAVAPWVGTYEWQPRVDPSPPQSVRDMGEATEHGDRICEWCNQQVPRLHRCAVEPSPLAQESLEDWIVREARAISGPRTHLQDSEALIQFGLRVALRAALVAPTLPLQNQDTKDDE